MNNDLVTIVAANHTKERLYTVEIARVCINAASECLFGDWLEAGAGTLAYFSSRARYEQLL
jgi:hypothetical protein